MPETTTKLHAVRTRKQVKKDEAEINLAIQRLINGDGDPTRNLAYLINLFSAETESRTWLRDVALEAVFTRSDAYDTALLAFLGYANESVSKSESKAKAG